MRRLLFGLAILAIGFACESAAAWKNPRKSDSLTQPVFGTHDYIAFKAYVLAGRPSFIRFNLNAYFIGTEAPDNGLQPPDAEDDYPDATQYHCILFDAAANVTRDRSELRVRHPSSAAG